MCIRDRTYLAYPDLKPPFLTLIASGGHSEIVMVRDYTSFEILGGTRDDAAGEAFDKVARVLGVGYPGGPKIDKLAREGDPKRYKLPDSHIKDAPLDFSFSGLKTAVINLAHNEMCIRDRQVLDAMGLTRCELAGYEADDLIGTISRRADEHGDSCVIVRCV